MLKDRFAFFKIGQIKVKQYAFGQLTNFWMETVKGPFGAQSIKFWTILHIFEKFEPLTINFLCFN